MSAAPPSSGPKGEKKDKGDDDQTIAKITGVVVASGIVWSLYKSVNHRKSSKPVPASQPIHEELEFVKPHEIAAVEAKAKETGGYLKQSAGNLKSSVDGKLKDIKTETERKGSDLKSSAGGKASLGNTDDLKAKGKDLKSQGEQQGKDLKQGLDSKAKDTKNDVAEKSQEAKNTGVGFFQKLFNWDSNKNLPPKHSSKPESSQHYEIVRGDTLWSISRRYDVSLEKLQTANGISFPDYIIPGDTLVIPPK